MDDLSGIRKDITTIPENVETSDGRSTPAQNELVLRLEQRILELQRELEQPDVGMPEGYKPPKFEMFDGTGDPKVHPRTYCDKLAGVGKNEQIRMKLFMLSLTRDALSWYVSQNPKKWVSWAAKVRPALEEEQMNKFFVRAQELQYYERLMVIENHKISDVIKLGERIEEGIKSGMVPNFEALHATNKALQSGGIWKKNEAGVAKEAAPNIRNNPLLDHIGEGVNVIETGKEWDSEGSIGLIREGDDPKPKHLLKSR
uniref:Retrotransposon gag domain-containing protein n=1 Tax=Nicotiana tabacum TaxID=4097 RepID=A0A1S4AWU7_TOBAC|nr:PREDICTED: uncharacterized protein LOC107802157 [Nicotiana tabacum]